MYKVRAKIIFQMYRNKDVLKAIALSVYIKNHTTSSLVKNWSINKVVSLTGMGASTIKKRLQTLRNLDLIEEVGSHLLFKRLKSGCNRKNIDITSLLSNRVKDIEKSLWAFLIVLIQRQKDYVNLKLQRVHKARTLKEVKDAVHESKFYGWHSRFVDNGLSYIGIARKLGVCLKTAFEIVRYGIAKGFFRKVSHFFCFGTKGAGNLKEIPDNFTFISKKGNLYDVKANSYILCSKFSLYGNN